jgi:general secretion pathway protein G
MRKKIQRDSRGFTLLEMMVVLSVMLILLSVTMPIYSQTIRREQEDTFRQNLETLNRMIVQFTLDKQRAPKSLDDLKAAKYIERVPDDITGTQTWETEEDPEMIMAIGQTEGGIYAVKSGSNRIGSNGKPYSEW